MTRPLICLLRNRILFLLAVIPLFLCGGCVLWRMAPPPKTTLEGARLTGTLIITPEGIAALRLDRDSRENQRVFALVQEFGWPTLPPSIFLAQPEKLAGNDLPERVENYRDDEPEVEVERPIFREMNSRMPLEYLKKGPSAFPSNSATINNTRPVSSYVYGLYTDYRLPGEIQTGDQVVIDGLLTKDYMYHAQSSTIHHTVILVVREIEDL